MRIKQLTAAVANQIAAGEVIERPASIVKELLENAQDAKADTITIDIGHGGLNQVRISDNGMGIVAEDLPLALAAHATSKISCLGDLYAITSMGFRGEALASIASVARVSISSKPAAQATGMILDNHSARPGPCARAPGTTIDVRDIFFNAPVRKKFLKSERSEFQAIDKIVRCFALGSPDIAITLNHNGKLQLQLPAVTDERSRLSRIGKVLGKSFVEHSQALDARHAGMRLHGWISDRTLQRSQNDKVWVYLNGRMVKDKLINHAIKQAYEGVLHPGRFPSCLLYFTLDPAEVDVNVHPTKHEVRFQQPRYIHDFIRTQVQSCLQIPSPVEDYAFDSRTLSSTRTPLTVREFEVAPDYHVGADEPAPKRKNNPSLVLNEQFSILVMRQTPYLVDMFALQKRCLLESLQKSEFPLVSRPLLVPIYLETATSTESLQLAMRCLRQLGVALDVAERGRVMIRSLPCQVPDVSIKALVMAIVDSPRHDELSRESLLELLLDHCSMDSQTMSEERYCECLEYFRVKSGENDAGSFAKPLSLTFCQSLFHA